MRNVLLLALVMGASSSAYAGHEHAGPCRKIIDACVAGGYPVGGHGKKGGKGGAKIDCFDKIMAGQKIDQVSPSDEEIANCKTKMAKHHK